jgi:predicted nucleic acid-binding protein
VIVVDTNVLLYYWVSGSRTAAAEAVHRKDGEWVAPPLWRSEFRNALATFVQQRIIVLDVALHLVSQAERQMAGREYAVVGHRILTLATRSGCSAYDCEFVALAEELQRPLVTSDSEVLRAFPPTAVRLETFAAS